MPSPAALPLIASLPGAGRTLAQDAHEIDSLAGTMEAFGRRPQSIHEVDSYLSNSDKYFTFLGLSRERQAAFLFDFERSGRYRRAGRARCALTRPVSR
jgi:hypothetical protein